MSNDEPRLGDGWRTCEVCGGLLDERGGCLDCYERRLDNEAEEDHGDWPDDPEPVGQPFDDDEDFGG